MPAQGDSSSPQAQATDASTQATAPTASSAPEQTHTTATTPINATFATLMKAVPASERATVADRLNAQVLRLMGYRTKATGHALWELAHLAEAKPRTDLWDTTVISRESLPETQHPTTTSIPEALADRTLEFEPFHFFFYGTLQDPVLLSLVCGLPSSQPPVLRRARIRGWRVKLWGVLPMLVPYSPRSTELRGGDSEKGKEGGEEGVVEGYVWKCELPQHVDRLRLYEPTSYRMTSCAIESDADEDRDEAGTDEDGEKAATVKPERKTKIIENGRVFVGADDGEILEDSFDL